MFFNVRTAVLLAVMAVTSASTVAAQDFNFRFYDNNSGCNHNSPAGATYPPNNLGPETGAPGVCYSAPTGTNWNELEINNEFSSSGVVTFCNVGCAGGSSPLQNDKYCYTPPAGCAVGSFIVV